MYKVRLVRKGDLGQEVIPLEDFPYIPQSWRLGDHREPYLHDGLYFKGKHYVIKGRVLDLDEKEIRLHLEEYKM